MTLAEAHRFEDAAMRLLSAAGWSQREIANALEVSLYRVRRAIGAPT